MRAVCMLTSFSLNIKGTTTLDAQCASAMVDYASPSLLANSRCIVREQAMAKGDTDPCAVGLTIECVPTATLANAGGNV